MKSWLGCFLLFALPYSLSHSLPSLAETASPVPTLSSPPPSSVDSAGDAASVSGGELEVDSDEDVAVPVKTRAVRKHITEEIGGTIRGKETEGTKAQNRFQAEQVLTSRYRLNGRELEVDTD